MEQEANLNDLISNPEKYLFGYSRMSMDEQSEYTEGFYSQHPHPNKKFDEFGLRYDIDYLNAIGSEIILCPVEFIANYVDVVTKQLVDEDDESFIWQSMSDSQISEEEFPNLNATALGNIAYLYLHTTHEVLREIGKELLIKIIIWKAKQYNTLIEGLKTVN